ncbi:MAG: hypothetical protein A2Z75_07860 [Chloroflexi bacterium RBG_13_50_10]|nr:MAG: hypothetical protein A2Z75_07860 [Chloroflexi bacterium RBG_13_50_10]
MPKTDAHMTPRWRQFEEFIARIEQAMAPTGAVVKSPDWIPDKVTGELREVDASIRYKIGTCPVLVTIECRDRGCTEDVRWIEQLSEKQRSIGAAIMVAASSKGFSVPAAKKAAALGIQIRTLTDASPDDFIQWLRFQNVQLSVTEWSLDGLALQLYDAPPDAELSQQVQDLFRKQGPLAPIFIRNWDGKRLHIRNILIEWNKRNGSFYPENVPDDGTKVQRTLHQPMERNCLHVETTRGKYDVHVIHISLFFSKSQSLVPLARLAEYAGPSDPLVHTAEWDILKDVTLSLHRDLASGETKVGLTTCGEENGA